MKIREPHEESAGYDILPQIGIFTVGELFLFSPLRIQVRKMKMNSQEAFD